jgi:hypothetical protein
VNDKIKNPIILILLGLALGVGGTMGLSRLRHRHRKLDPERLTQRFTRDLNLNAEQEKAVHLAMAASAAKLQSLREETAGKFKEIRVATRADVRKLLDPEQQKKFDDIAARWDARHGHDAQPKVTQQAPAPDDSDD